MNQVSLQEKSFDNALSELNNIQEMTNKLLQMKHFQKMGDVGIFAIIQKAKSIGLNPLDAINGGCYFVNGKVELSSNTMNYLIRQAGHSVIKDEKSNKEICILRGKRIDNGDTFTCSFSIEDAKKAGILKNVWLSYPEDMLFARALSCLARQLFPDVCKGCYTEGELPKDKDFEKAEYEEVKPASQIEHIEYITMEQQEEIKRLVSECDPDKVEAMNSHIQKKCNGGDLSKLQVKCFSVLRDLLTDRRDKYQAERMRAIMEGDEVENGSAE